MYCLPSIFEASERMHPSSQRGNQPETWQLLLNTLDEKLQLGLLDHLKRAESYHFEATSLEIKAGNQADFEYLSKPAVHQQLTIFAEQVANIEQVKILQV